MYSRNKVIMNKSKILSPLQYKDIEKMYTAMYFFWLPHLHIPIQCTLKSQLQQQTC